MSEPTIMVHLRETTLADAPDRVGEVLLRRGFTIPQVVASWAWPDCGRPSSTVLEAHHPELARRARAAHPRGGMLLPCNVVIEPEGSGVKVTAVQLGAMLGGAPTPALAGIASEAQARVRAALRDLAEGPAASVALGA